MDEKRQELIPESQQSEPEPFKGKKITRRDFLRIVGATAGAAALKATGIEKVAKAFEEQTASPKEKKRRWNPSEQILPHFKGHDRETGELVEIQGSPRAITTRNGKVSVEFYEQASDKTIDVDPLSIVSGNYGEHPADKTLRLTSEYGLTIDSNLEERLRNPSERDSLCHRVTFEYLPSKEQSGVIAKLAPDGSFVTIMNPVPLEWHPPTQDYLTPKFFGVYPDHIVSASIAKAKKSLPELKTVSGQLVELDAPIMAETPGQEKEVVAVRNRYLAAYQKVLEAALDSSKYNQLLENIGFGFDPEVYGPTIQEKAEGILRAPRGTSLYSAFWTGRKLKEIGLSLGNGELMASYCAKIDQDLYLATSGGYPDSEFGRLYKLTKGDKLELLYEAPGRFLLAMPNPQNPNKLLISAEGHEDGRFQALFEVDLPSGNWQVINFPGDSRRGKPELYGCDGCYSENGTTLFLNRYGFKDEGGGLWALNLTDYTDKAYLVTWDHLLSWVDLSGSLGRVMPLPKPTPTPSPTPTPTPEVPPMPMTPAFKVFLPAIHKNYPKPTWLAITGKEVDDPEYPFAMTISQARLEGKDMDTSIVDVQRRGIFVGWNPVIRSLERQENGKTLIYCEVYYNYESCLESRPEGIYKVEIPS